MFTARTQGAVTGVPTMDANGIQSGNAFLVSELEKRDPLIRKPLTSVTYPRDIVIQSGGGWVDYVSAMTVAYGMTGGAGASPVTAGSANGIPIVQASVDKGVFKAHTFAAAPAGHVAGYAAGQLHRPVPGQSAAGRRANVL